MERNSEKLKQLDTPGVEVTTGGFVLEKKDTVEPSLLSKKLGNLGYSNIGQSIPNTAGEFSIRGGVVDIWLERYKRPVRIDLLGDKIEGIYLFEPSSGEKIKHLGEVYVVPFKATPVKEIKWPKSVKRGANKYERLFLSEIQPGDYAVHIDHGIGRFLGVEDVHPRGVPQVRPHLGGEKVGEALNLVIEYAKGDRLFVPVNQIERVTKFIGNPGFRPPLNYLGTGAWERTKERIKKSVVNIARELLQIYAVRETVKRAPYLSDSPWQRQLSESFPYTETQDQINALADISTDFRGSTPMDRLLVGDVGFGKTEVALRAAFKVVESGFQVAVLTPTTLLAEQHYHVFKDRLLDFPVTIDYLSRFASKKEIKERLADLKSGKLDIVIGTQRLLSVDVEFKRLSLLIIDEEHRFGVVAKEELKKKRLEVDVLSISATPIPRTLHMTLAKIRDISTLSIPPEGRLSIETKLLPLDWEKIREALLLEKSRGGQSYFVHNRIGTLMSIAKRIADLTPKLKIVYAHGQMPGSELEKVMNGFYDGEADVLVCTTIIGSGLDMPNVNTIFIDNAHKFGLADLHQLRGRVGRAYSQAYAYLFVPQGYTSKGTVYERLMTISEESELGAGFKIASRDLEIRGAGNLLGREQHGFINIVGFELYLRLLNKAVEMLKEGKSLRRV